MIRISSKSSFTNIQRKLNKNYIDRVSAILQRYALDGLSVLRANTPTNTGLLASSWAANVTVSKNEATVTWSNTDETPYGTPIVILVHYGHATKDGGFIQGIDFINPSMKPIFEQIRRDIEREVSS